MAGSSCFGQDFFRISADVSIKTKGFDGKMMLVVGKVYYDKNEKKTVYAMRFPYKEYWVQQDTILYKIVNDTVKSTSNVSVMDGSNLYQILLNQKLGDFGLGQGMFDVIDIWESGDLVITTLKPKPPADQVLSKIVLENSNTFITKITVFDKKDQPVMIQSFTKYENIKGLNIPLEMVKVMINNNQTSTELMKLSNIKLNDFENNSFYNYPIPAQ